MHVECDPVQDDVIRLACSLEIDRNCFTTVAVLFSTLQLSKYYFPDEPSAEHLPPERRCSSERKIFRAASHDATISSFVEIHWF